MLSLTLPLILGAVAQDESPRLRTLLANGTVLLVERMPSTKHVSVQLFAGIKGAEETTDRHGWRHLLEHLILKGKDGKLDRRMEDQGVFFTGRTYRRATQIDFTCSPAKLELALQGLVEILEPLKTTPEAITREVGIIEHELAAWSDAGKLSRTAWTTAFGDAAQDPLGKPEAMAKATPVELERLRKAHFDGSNLVVVACGPVDVKQVTERLRTLFEDRDGEPKERFRMPEGHAGRGQADDCFGEIRAAIANSFTESAAPLCAAYGIASRLDNAFVNYVPAPDRNRLMVGRTDANNTVGLFIDSMTEGDEGASFTIGKLLADRWLTGALANPTSNGYVRGMLLVDDPSSRPEDLLAAIRKLTWPEYRAAIAQFKRDKAVIAIGAPQ